MLQLTSLNLFILSFILDLLFSYLLHFSIFSLLNFIITNVINNIPYFSINTQLLDLDNTVVHVNEHNFGINDEIVHHFLLKDKPYYVILRPGVIDFIKNISEFFEIRIVTRASRVYATKVLFYSFLKLNYLFFICLIDSSSYRS